MKKLRYIFKLVWSPPKCKKIKAFIDHKTPRASTQVS